MSALVHMPHSGRFNLYLKPQPAEGIEVGITRSKFGVEFVPAAGAEITAELLSGKEAGTKVSKIAANQRAKLLIGNVAPTKYQGIVSINPAFNEVATVQAPLVLEPKEATELTLVINAHKEVDLGKLSWFCRVYLFE